MQLVADMEQVPQYAAEGERNRLKIICVLRIVIQKESCKDCHQNTNGSCLWVAGYLIIFTYFL